MNSKKIASKKNCNLFKTSKKKIINDQKSKKNLQKVKKVKAEEEC